MCWLSFSHASTVRTTTASTNLTEKKEESTEEIRFQFPCATRTKSVFVQIKIIVLR